MPATDRAAPRCGISLHQMQDDEQHFHIRIAPEDIAAAKVQRKGGTLAAELKPGVYSCGREMYDLFKPLIVARLRKTQAISDSGHPMFRDADGNIVYDSAKGKPVMVLGPDDDAAGHSLM